jgi:hypothetical protein
MMFPASQFAATKFYFILLLPLNLTKVMDWFAAAINTTFFRRQ